MSQTYKCKGCGAPTRWVRTVAGKNMICDERIVQFNHLRPRENLVTTDGRVVVRRTLDETLPDVSGYRPHWPNCPNAREFRR